MPFRPAATFFIALLLLQTISFAEEPPAQRFDVVVYGATPAGIAAAVPIARRDPDSRIALVTRYKRIGGLMTNGLTHPDFRTFEGRTGLFLEINQRVEAYYREKYGPESQQVADSLSGTHAEPEVNYIILAQIMDELPGIEIFTEHRLEAVQTNGGTIESATFVSNDSNITFAADFFVDATYEGDLMAAAGVPFRVGREAQSEYGESLAPETADGQVQGYNFRLTMTNRPENMAPVPKPDGYNREDYLELLPLLEHEELDRIFEDRYQDLKNGIYKRQTPKLPNGKRDINDVSRGRVRLSMPQINDEWPGGDAETRQRIFAQHVRHNIGMLYFLQNDEAVPEKYQHDANQWGFCKDEYVYNNHMPEQLYVREARRMIGRYVFTQEDTNRAPNTGHARAVYQPDAIAMGDYGLNCHGTDHEGPLYGGEHTGEFYKGVAPYQIPYGVLLPENIDNLTVPIASSSSHVGFCALRLEPIWMALGQASGEAIALALKSDSTLPDLAPRAIQTRLHDSGAATIYTSDVPESSPDFPAVQWWGSHGGFIALDRQPDEEPADYGKRGPRIIGQYCEAFLNHAVDLDMPISEPVRKAWLELAEKAAPKASDLESAPTRGDFIRAAWQGR